MFLKLLIVSFREHGLSFVLNQYLSCDDTMVRQPGLPADVTVSQTHVDHSCGPPAAQDHIVAHVTLVRGLLTVPRRLSLG